MFQKNLKYAQLSQIEARVADVKMRVELMVVPNGHAVRKLYHAAWESYVRGEFAYDGATFVRERNSGTIFEVAAFVHDWRNSRGCVGRSADQEMFDIMIKLNYPLTLIIERWFYCRFTFLNVARHRIRKTICRQLPRNIYKLSNQ